MRHFIIIVLLLAFASWSATAETFKAPQSRIEHTDSTTSHQYEIKGEVYPIFKSKRGRLYIWRVSKKTNKPYKYYIPKDIEEKIKQSTSRL